MSELDEVLAAIGMHRETLATPTEVKMSAQRQKLLAVIAKLREQRNNFNGNDTPGNLERMDAELLKILKGEQ